MNKVYQQYFTNSKEIVEYMTDKLSIESGNKIFEPCIGEGVFIDEICKRNIKVEIDGCDLDPSLVNKGIEKYKSYNYIDIDKKNFLFDKINKSYDRVIANPPYGAWIDYDDRKKLKKIYPNLYVKETYALFLYKSITLLNENGRLVFIIPSSYLFLHMHKALRKFIWDNTEVEEIVKFPSKFFPGIAFGYSTLSIITLKKKININNKFRLFFDLKSPNELSNLDLKTKFIEYKQNDLLTNKDYSIYFSENEIIEKLIKKYPTIGDYANCATGIYTGDNKSYLYYLDETVKNINGYKKVDTNKVDFSNTINLNGFTDNYEYVPIYKGAGQSKIYKKIEWFIKWDNNAIDFYKNNKKARFQNSQYYFKFGIGVPMVKTKTLTAFKMDGYIFDQSIVGVFPKDTKYFMYILGLFNSSVGSDIINAINPTANNSSNYIKKIPFVIPTDDDLNVINEILNDIINNNEIDIIDKNNDLDSIYEKIYYGDLNDI